MGRKYRYRTRPYAHQVRAIRKLLQNGDGGELFMEPRTGKTKTAIDYASILSMKGEIDKVLVVAPARVLHTWVEQFYMHSPLIVNVTIWDAKERRKGSPPPVRGSYDLNVVLVNYEAFSTPGKRLKSGRRSRASGRFKHRQHLRKWLHSTSRNSLFILDESHRIANPSGSAATLIVTMQGDARFKLLLTGTPVTKAKKQHDLYMQYKFRDPKRFGDIATADDFKNTFGRWIHDNGYPQWIGARNQQLLKERIHRTAIVVRRDDCFDLPPRQTIIRRIPLVDSARVYDEMAAEMVAKIIQIREERKKKIKEEHIVEASIKLVQGLRLRQITGGVATTDEGRLIRIGREKLNALREEFEAAQEHEEKIVVCAQFKADLNAITRMARSEFRLPTFQLRGGISLDQTARDLRDFARLDGCGVYVVQPQSGSEGIDLSTAPHMVWYSLTPSWVKYTQMSDRIALSRISTTFTYLLGTDTVDEVLYQTLQTDGEVARAILDKPERLLRNPAQMSAVEDALTILRRTS